MDIGAIRKMRLIHMLILSGLVVFALLDWFPANVPHWELIIAVGFVAMWMLGIRYERNVVLHADLATAEELKEAEEVGYWWVGYTPPSEREAK